MLLYTRTFSKVTSYNFLKTVYSVKKTEVWNLDAEKKK